MDPLFAFLRCAHTLTFALTFPIFAFMYSGMLSASELNPQEHNRNLRYRHQVGYLYKICNQFNLLMPDRSFLVQWG